MARGTYINQKDTEVQKGVGDMQKQQQVGNIRQGHGTPSDSKRKQGVQNYRAELYSRKGRDGSQKLRNNKSQEKLSKKKRDSIKKKQQKEAEQKIISENTPQNTQEKSDNPKKLCMLSTVTGINVEYSVINSEDEFDQDTQSMEWNNDEEEVTDTHLIKAFGSTIHTGNQEEVQEATGKHGLSQGVGNNRDIVTNKHP